MQAEIDVVQKWDCGNKKKGVKRLEGKSGEMKNSSSRKEPIKARLETEDEIWSRNAGRLTRCLLYRDKGGKKKHEV